jgi:dTDP-6-deoxy-L-talose 4-dehydrogenase (NAD+)
MADGTMKIAVTGATGFIGRHIVAELERNSISAVLVCRPSSDIPAEMSKHTVVRIDLREVDENTYERIGAPDILIHLAWGGLPNYRSLHHFENELPIQYRFLKTLVESGLGSVLVTGTCFEYGMQSGPLSEDSVVRPDNPYAFAKDALRRELEFMRQMKPFQLTWARLFYLYGEGQSGNSLFPQLKRAVEQGERGFDMSDGEQLRDYLPVGVAARYLVSLAMSRDHGVVNICSGKPISVRKLVEHWLNVNDWKINLNLGRYPYPDYEPLAFWGVRHKLDHCLGLA